MKKLLSLLSVLTISGTVLPTSIATSPYQKQKTIENINNKRQKRSNNENNKINITKIVIHSGGSNFYPNVVLNNKIYFSKDGNVYEYDPTTEQQKIIIKTNSFILFSCVVFNNKLYAGSWDHNVYEYDPVTKQQKIVITANDRISGYSIVFNNKLYFGSWDGNVYEYDPVTKQQNIVITANARVFSSGVVLNNKLYFGSDDNNVYEYDPTTEQQKVVIKTNGKVTSSGFVLNNKLYFNSDDKNVYEYDPIIEQQKVVITANDEFSDYSIVFNNKLYIGSRDGNVYEYDPIIEQQKVVIKTNNWVINWGVIFNNKLYFGSWDGNVYEYDPVTKQQKIVITANAKVWPLKIVFNNKIYFGSYDGNVYEYDPTTEQQKIIITANDRISSSGMILNNKLYIGSDDDNIYEYNNYYWDLGQINDNSDNVILNELSYLDPYLNISELKIIDKTNSYATVKAKNNNNKYFVKNKIYYNNINQQNKIINLNELIKKASLFKFRDENFKLKFKKIDYFDINDLNFENVEITRNKNLKWHVDFKNVCFNTKERINKSSVKKTVKIPECEYNQKSKFMFQIIKGISKYQQDNSQVGWNLNMDDENKLWDFVNINYRDQTITHSLSNKFDFANLNKQEQEMILYRFNEPEDEIELVPNEKATIFYLVRERKYESILNLKQKINGKVTATVTKSDGENETFVISIKEAMQILQKYSLLPDEITINEDNSITFNGKAIFSLIRDDKPKLILNTEII